MDKLIVSNAPHIHTSDSSRRVMLDVVIALLPATVAAVVIFGTGALKVIAACVIGAVVSEALFDLATHRKQTVGDFSAVVTGLLLGLNLSSSVPVWQCVVGSAFAIIIVKCLFGGLGHNFANPAIVGRITLFIGFATPMTNWVITDRMSQAIINYSGPDAVAGATPLAINAAGGQLPSNLEMFLGTINGSMGEVSTIALLIGGIYLVIRKVISPAIPVSFLATVAVLSLVMGFDPIFQLCAGGVMLGAIFMATDYVTSPITTPGRIIFGIGCGVFTMLIRSYASYPEGVSFAILLMNILTPHIDRITRSKLNGVAKGGAKA